MKRTVLLAGIAFVSMSLFTSCGGSKSVERGDVEVIVPCSGPEYMTNNQYIRATGISVASDMNIAKKKALSSARSEIAASIETMVKTVVDDYSSSYQMGEADESKRKFQEMSRQVVKQKLNGLRIICNKLMRTPEGTYRAYIALELAGSDLVESIATAVNADDKLRLDFEYEKFKEIFEEEMNKMK